MMTCEEILKALRDGKAVKRRNENYYFLLADDAIVEYSINNSEWVTSNQSFCFRLDEIKKDKLDFEIYEPKLTESEREYLSGFLRPFMKNYKITIRKYSAFKVGEESLFFSLQRNTDEKDEAEFALPFFKAGTMYAGMELGKEYTLEELGL